MSARIFLNRVLDELNDEIFSPRSLRLNFLKHYPEWIPLLAAWEYGDWHAYDHLLTKEKLIEGFTQRLHDDQLPLVLVIFRAVLPIGVISLENRAEPELADLEDGDPWGGSFHIEAQERGRGVGEAAGRALTLLAKRLGYRKIWFYTSNSRAVKWYVRQGASIVATRPFRGHEVTVMKYDL